MNAHASSAAAPTPRPAANTSAKAEILERLHAALADKPTPPEVQRSYRREELSSRAEIIEQFVDRLVDYKAGVYRERPDTVADRVLELVGEGARVVLPQQLAEEWIPEGLDIIREPEVGADGALTVRELDEVAAVITNSTVSCSETGTIFLSGRPDEGRRAITLVPDHHVCIVLEDRVVEFIPQALEAVEPTATITMISGPSATSDIELERVEGVHGPRTLDVIIVGAS